MLALAKGAARASGIQLAPRSVKKIVLSPDKNHYKGNRDSFCREKNRKKCQRFYLFGMVVGEETPDEGSVSVPGKMTIGRVGHISAESTAWDVAFER